MDIETMETIGGAQPAEKSLKGAIAELVAQKSHGRQSLVTPELKGTPGPILTPQYEYVNSHNVGVGTGRLGIADLFSYEAINGNAYSFVQIFPKDGAFAGVEEAGTKPLVDYTRSAELVPLCKVAGVIKETDELVEDAEYVARAIETRAVYDLKREFDRELIFGAGASGEFLGLTGWSGLGSEQYPNGQDMDEATLLAAICAVTTNSGLSADGIIMNPSDYAALVSASLSNPRTLFGQDYTTFMGLPIVLNDQITAGTAIVGAFKLGGTVVTKGGIRVEMTNSNEDDFIKNLWCIRVEQRAALAVRVPGAFVIVDEASA